MMRTATALVVALLVSGCDTGSPAGLVHAHELDPVFAHVGGHANALVEGAWGADQQWELVKPRPPGIGADDGTRTRLYQIAPVVAGSPLSPALNIPGVIEIAGRDHVVRPPQGNRGTFTGIGQTVPVLLPGWEPGPPFDPAACAAPDLAAIADRIAWQWVIPTPHPCGRAPVVYGAQLEGDACVKPLTSVERVEAAHGEGLVQLAFPPEPAWPFAIRPLTPAGRGPAPVSIPACVPAGERA
jgi:hypothetical protein